LFRYGLKLLFIGLVTLPVGIAIFSVALFDRHGKAAYTFSRFWTWAVIRIGGIRLKVKGLERLDSNRPYIFMANHQSNIDIPVLIQALPSFQLRWVAKKELLYVPFFGLALWASKHILVERASLSTTISSLRKAKEKIAAGISVVVFPEGTRSTHGRLLPFKRGGFVLALQSRIPIVPVTINGTQAVLPKGDWRIRGGDVEIIVSEAVPVEPYRLADLEQLMTRVRTRMEAHYTPSRNSPREGLMRLRRASCAASPAKEGN
jgi:1-acyl-sn-glycerol-3-phosphate acyltransferase